MPWIEEVLPFSGSTPQSRHTSRAGAENAAPRALNQTLKYMAALKARPNGLTDFEAAEVLGIERTSVNARRRPLVKAGLVVTGGFRRGPTGIKNVIWKAT
jgi:hypothetical protein